jgi:hypothetical protein
VPGGRLIPDQIIADDDIIMPRLYLLLSLLGLLVIVAVHAQDDNEGNDDDGDAR